MVSITHMDLGALTEAELTGLAAQVSRDLAQAEPGSLEWEQGMILIARIRREQAQRRVAVKPRPKPPGPGF